MQQPATGPRLLSLAAHPPGTLLLSPHQPADAQRVTALLLNAGLIPKKDSRFCTPRVAVEKQGKHSATMMPPSRPVPPVPPTAGTTASIG